MPSQRLVSTRNQRKRKALELKANAPVKKARVVKMKELAEIYEKENNSNNSNNSSSYFNEFYLKQKVIYPLLTKESFRWHIRVKKKLKSDTTNIESTNKTVTLESVSTDQNHEVRSYDL